MITTTGSQLKILDQEFNDRVPEDGLNYILSYIDFGEEPLAFETLCDYICEGDIFISNSEYKKFVCLICYLILC